MFALQVNVERMPHGLFRRLRQARTRSCSVQFAAAFLLAIAVTTLSLVLQSEVVGLAVFIAAWATFVILILFLYGYRRALALISPRKQLRLVVAPRQSASCVLGQSGRIGPDPLYASNEAPGQTEHDLARFAYFKTNPAWTHNGIRAVQYAMSFARRYAGEGDYEISQTALNSIIEINIAYIRAKGRTFFAEVPFLRSSRLETRSIL